MIPENQNQPQSFGPPAGTPESSGPSAAAQPNLVGPVAAEAVVSPSGAPAGAFDPTGGSVAVNPMQPGITPAATGQAFGTGTPAGYPAAPAGAPAAKSNNKLVFVLIGGFIIIVLAVGGGMLLYLSKSIKPKDVTAAQAASTALRADIHDADTSLSDLDISTDTNKVNQTIGLINTKLTDAEKQYNTLKSSPIQHDKDTKKKFDAFAAKWPTFVGYLRDNSSDLKALSPVLTDLSDKTDALARNTPKTPAELTTYLTSYKAILDGATTHINSLHLKVSENQQFAALFKDFLQSATTDTVKTQQDLAAGKTSTATSDLLKIQDDESTFFSKSQDVENKIEQKRDQVNPINQYLAFTTQLSKLAAKVK